MKPGGAPRSSRDKILDAATTIAADRGYDATSIKLLSQGSGLPASSIYWHFADKDQLISAAIDRNFERFLELLDSPIVVDDDGTPEEQFRAHLRHVADAVAAYPDFLRLGLMLTLQRKPSGWRARRRFVEGREVTRARARELCQEFFGDLEADQLDALVVVTMALADGMLVAGEAEGIDVHDGYDLAASAILGIVEEFRRTKRPAPASRGRPPRRSTPPR